MHVLNRVATIFHIKSSCQLHFWGQRERTVIANKVYECGGRNWAVVL